MKIRIEVVQHDQRNILKMLCFSYHALFLTYDVICELILLFRLILSLNCCFKDLNLVWFFGKFGRCQSCSKWSDKPFTKICFHSIFYFQCITSWMTLFARFSLIVPLNYCVGHLNIVFTKRLLQLKLVNMIRDSFSKNHFTHT